MGINTAQEKTKFYVKKSSSTNRTGSGDGTTPLADSHLTMTLKKGIYHIFVSLAMTNDSQVSDIKMNYDISGITQLSTRGATAPHVGDSDTTVTLCRLSRHNLTTEVQYGGDGTTASTIHEEFLINVTGSTGIITLKWCADNVDTNVVSLTSNSYMIAEKIESL